MNVAQSVRLKKEKHPEIFCQNAKCLWRIWTLAGPNPCPNHPIAQVAEQTVACGEVPCE